MQNFIYSQKEQKEMTTLIYSVYYTPYLYSDIETQLEYKTAAIQKYKKRIEEMRNDCSFLEYIYTMARTENGVVYHLLVIINTIDV